MTLRDYLKVARRWALVVVLGCVLSGGAAYLLTTRMDKVYQARAVILVNQRENQAAPSLQDIQGSQSLTKTYAELVTTSNNLERAAQILGNTNIKSLQKKVSADAVPETQLIEVLAEDRNADRAALIANTVAGLFPGYVEEAQLAGSETRTTINTVFVAEKALAPEDPVRPNPRVNVILGLVLGLIVMVAAVGLIEYFDDGVKEREDIERLAVPYLGSVLLADVPKGADKQEWVPSILSADPGDDLIESYRQVQASLAFALMASDVKVLLVTSPGQGEGKSTTAANLAEALAESSRRVLLVDGDLRKPDAHRYFSLPNSSGLTSTFLVDPQALPAFINHVGESLSVLTGGPVAPNPTELLSSRKMKATIDALAEMYDIVVIDCPPMLGLADASLWMPLVDGVLLVARQGKTRRSALEETVAAVRAGRKPLLGVVLNGSDRKRHFRYGYGYAYGYTRRSPQ